MSANTPQDHPNTIHPEILERFKKIRLLGLDVDGVLTDGSILYTDDGREMKRFNVKDGHGISMLTHRQFQVAIITGRSSPITDRRAMELGIQHVYQGIKTKLPVIEQIAQELGLTLGEVAYMGDDTPDIPVLEAVGLALCPADAVDEVKRICHYTTKRLGGHGAVREIADLILLALDRPEQAIKPFFQEASQTNR